MTGIYYGLKCCIFVEVDVLFVTGRNMYISIFKKYAKGKQFFFKKIFASNTTKQGFSILNLSEDYQQDLLNNQQLV